MWVAVGLVVVLVGALLYRYVFGGSGPSPFDFDSREPLKPMVHDKKEKNKVLKQGRTADRPHANRNTGT